jgi:hypothetical protein
MTKTFCDKCKIELTLPQKVFVADGNVSAIEMQVHRDKDWQQ